MGDLRRAAPVIGCGESDLRARITSNCSEGGGGSEFFESGDQSDGRASL